MATENKSALASASDDGASVTDDVIVVQAPEHPKLTLFQTCNIVVCSVGGSGIFVAISTMMKTTGSVGAMLIVVLVSGLMNFSLANCFTEVATLLPKAGGPYFFIQQVFGPFPAFLFFWSFFFLIIIPVWAYLSLTSSLYLLQLFFQGCEPPVLATKLMAAVILVLVVLVNCLYLKYVAKIQTFLTSAKMFVMALIVVLGLFAIAQGEGENYKNLFEGSSTQPGDYAVGIMSGMFLFGGWQIITFLLEEMETPERNLPRTLSISFVIVITFSEAIVAAYFVVLTPREVLSTNAVAMLFTDRIFRPLTPLVSVMVTLTSIGGLNAVVLAQSRLVSAVANQGHMPVLATMTSVRYHMPWAAILLVTLCSLVMIFFVDLSSLIIMTSFCATVMGLAVLLCLLGLRIRQPNVRRPFKVSHPTIIFQMVINTATLVMSIYQQPVKIGTLALFVLSGTPVYIVFVTWKSKLKPLNTAMDKITILLQKLLILNKP